MNALDLAFKVAEAFGQAGDVPARLDGLDQFRPPPLFIFQVLGQRFNRDQSALPRHLIEPLPKLLLALIDGRFQNLRAQNPLLNRVEQLFLQPVLADQQLVVTRAVVLVLMATVFYVGSLAATGAHNHAAPAFAAD